jgi:hypothetical protein
MHYDAEILDSSIFDQLFNAFENVPNDTASVTACTIVDLLVLYDTEKIRAIGGWDENFKNSYMELDLRNRIFNNSMQQIILYTETDCPPEVKHTAASSLRRHTIEGNIAKVYDESFTNDMIHFFEKYPHENKPDFYDDYIEGKLKFSA